MALFRILWAFLTSRWLWTFIGLACVSLLIWFLSPQVRFGEAEPFANEAVRLGLIAGLFLLWLVWMILAQRRAIRANRLFVTELAAPSPLDPEAEAVSALGARFQSVLDEFRRRKLGGRGLLRDMPWYVIIGPPAGGKTTALRQSGLDFPVDLGDDLRGVGGTRDCDWFFTEQAVLIDTAGRYALQESQPKVDAAEWLGFLDLLRKHRGRRALNGVLVAIPVDALSGGEAGIRAHGREIRKRLAELQTRLGTRLPVYLVLTKADLIAGFEPSFANLGTGEREQVWGATFAPGERADGGAIGRELALLVRRLEDRVGSRLEATEDLATRAAIFRFPAQVASLDPALRLLVDTLFGESRYEDSAWLRGFYLTSATQEGTPIDRLTGALAASFGLPAAAPARGASRVERRSFFLRRLLTDVIFPEAGLATLEPKAEARRIWIWRGGAVAAAAVLMLGLIGVSFSYLANRGAVAAQASAFEQSRGRLSAAAAQQVPRDIAPADLALGVGAVADVEAARAPLPGTFARIVGPSAAPELTAAQETAYARALRDLLEPRMVALLEATMWRQSRDPEFMLGALKAYKMMTGTSAIDAEYLAGWWGTTLPEFAAIPPFPDETAGRLQFDAIARMPGDPDFIAADPALMTVALRTICEIPLSRRAYEALLADPAATALKDWLPVSHAGANGEKIFNRRSGKTLRVGVDGIYTYAGYHEVVLPRLTDVAAKAAHDAEVFTDGCSENDAETVETLSQEMLKLYYDDFIAQWDGLLHDLTLAQLSDLPTANENLKDLAGSNSALRQLLSAVVAETDLARPPDPGAAPPDPGTVSKYLAKLGKLGKATKTAVKFIPGGGAAPDTSGKAVSDHFRPLRGTIAEVDGAPPALDTAGVALASLSATLQTIAASPDPEQAIKDQGGLAALTGAVANEAAALPEPVDAWLRGIAGDTTSLTRAAVVSQINAAWTADVLPMCQIVAGRYPLKPSGTSDSTVEDFARVFGPGQLIDTFIEEQVKPFVDMTSRPWRWRADLGLDVKSLAALEQARRIRDALFPGGAGPVMNFTLEPKDLSPSAARVTLNLDGQPLVYFNSAAKPVAMTWPGTDGSGVITLTFEPVDGSPDVMETESGPWAWLRMLRGGLTPGGLPEVFRLRLAAGGYSADFELRAASVNNPFDLKMFASFKCPARF